MLISSIIGAVFIPRTIEIVRQKIVERTQWEYVQRDNTDIPRYLYLLDQPKISEKQIIAFFIKNNPSLDRNYIERIAKLYCIESQQESVNTAITVAQMALETGFLQFNGSVKKSQNNFAGIGCIYENHQGNSFATIEEGIRAHIQHFKAYASPTPLYTPCVDSRYKLIQKSKFFGKLKTVHDFVGAWAMDENYGKKLEKLTHDLFNTPNS
jgi:flagellum-specific peptidoglycan hydrolase FlgJ